MKNWMKIYFGWLDLTDENEVEWAINYLTEHDVYPSVALRNRDASFIHFLVPEIAENEHKYALILNKMKNAHSSRARRQNPDKKPVTFHLSKSANKALAALAKGMSKTKIGMVESLIEEMNGLKRDCDRELQAEKEELAKRLAAKVTAAQKKAEESSLGRENNKLKVELAHGNAKASRLENEMKAALRRVCELEVSAGILPNGPISLSYEKEDEVRKRYLARLKSGIGFGQA